MKIAFVLYDGVTALDFVGAYDPETRVRTMGFRDDVGWDLWGLDEAVTATGGLTIETPSIETERQGANTATKPTGEAGAASRRP